MRQVGRTDEQDVHLGQRRDGVGVRHRARDSIWTMPADPLVDDPRHVRVAERAHVRAARPKGDAALRRPAGSAGT